MEARDINKEIVLKIIYLLYQVSNGDIETWLPLSGLAYNPVSRHTYNSMNQLLLSLAQAQKNYPVNNWLTFNQIQGAGGSVQKGEKSATVAFSDFIYLLNGHKILPKDAKRHLSEAQAKDSSITAYKQVGIVTRRFMKLYPVFNVAQTKGLDSSVTAPQLVNLSPVERFDKADEIEMRHGIAIHHVLGNSAYYDILNDVIQMPFLEQFSSTESYYATLFHEMIHWTGHAKRLNRIFGKRESPEYAFEELIAELGSAFLCAHFQLPAPLTSSAAYVKSWLTVLQDDHTYLLKALKFADSAMSYLIEKQTTNI